MQIVMAGSSGFLGTALRRVLGERGHDVVRLVRRPATGTDESSWDPDRGIVDRELVGSSDVVVNLAGSKLLGNPRSSRFRKTLHDSRVGTTRLLAEAIAAGDAPPAFIAQSGSAWYGDHGSELVTEDSDSRGDAFMTRVCRDWELATTPAAEAGARVCLLRTVPVVDRDSMVTKMLLPTFRLGLGARLGDGHHYFPVISLRDWVSAATTLVESPSAAGAFNMCAPTPATNREFTAAMAEAAGHRARLAAPAPVLRLAAGPMSSELLSSYRMVPAALNALGHEFADEDVRDVVAAGVRRPE